MTWHTYVRRIGLRLTPEEIMALEFLESRGFRFGQHFGIRNCLEKATEVFLREQLR